MITTVMITISTVMMMMNDDAHSYDRQYLTLSECGGLSAPASLLSFLPFYFRHCLLERGFEHLWFLVMQVYVAVFSCHVVFGPCQV